MTNTLTQVPTAGQTVRFVGNGTPFLDLTEGKTYKIIEVDSDGDAVFVDDANEESFIWQGTFDAYKLVEEESKSLTQVPTVGQAVRYVGDRFRWLTPGKEYKIIGIDGDYDAEFYDNDGDLAWVTEDNLEDFELAAEGSKSTFQVGDKVRMINNGVIAGAGQTENGEIYDVIEIHDDGDISIDDKSGGEQLVIWKKEMRGIEKVEGTVVEEKKGGARVYKFKSGDKVELLDTRGALGGFFIGNVYPIVRINHSGAHDYVLVTPSGVEGFANESSLKLAAQRLTEMPKVGDVIRYVSNEKRMGLTAGKAYEIIEVDEDGDANFVSDFGDDSFFGLASVRTFTLGNYELVSEAPVEITALPARPNAPTCGVGTTLEARVDALEARLHAMETGNVDIVAKINAAPTEITMSAAGFSFQTNPISSLYHPNEARKQAIESAEASLTKYDHIGGITKRGGFKFNGMGSLCDAEFIIDEKRGTVKCILTEQLFGRVHAEGFAKCDPTDVFNVTLGKAIALGRARRADVTEFAMAPQPTVAVGQKVDVLFYGSTEKTDEVGLEVVAIKDGKYPKFADGMYASDFVITNDSDAKY